MREAKQTQQDHLCKARQRSNATYQIPRMLISCVCPRSGWWCSLGVSRCFWHSLCARINLKTNVNIFPSGLLTSPKRLCHLHKTPCPSDHHKLPSTEEPACCHISASPGDLLMQGCIYVYTGGYQRLCRQRGTSADSPHLPTTPVSASTVPS